MYELHHSFDEPQKKNKEWKRFHVINQLRQLFQVLEDIHLMAECKPYFMDVHRLCAPVCLNFF